jgi:trans-aconitate methyltransferase
MSWNPALYDAKHAFVWQHGAALIELLQPEAGERILDLGCGTGQLTAQLAAAGANVLGVDLSEEMIAAARRQHPQLRFEIADARALPFDGEFDSVFSNAALHWVEEAESAAAGIARALKPGGRFVAEFGGRGNVKTLWGAIQAAFSRVVGDEAVSPWYFPGVAEYATVLERAGLEVTYATLFDRFTPLEGDNGLRNWVAMFGDHVLGRVPAERREAFLKAVEENARGPLRHEGVWFADYRRLRVVAGSPLAA